MSIQIQKLLSNPVALTLFLATIATTLAAWQNQYLKEKLILRPYAFVSRKQYFTVITSGFIHADWMHLIMNMVTFYYFAFNLEHYFTYLQCVRVGEMPTLTEQRIAEVLGHSKFLIIYLASMVLADLTTIIKYKDIPSYSCLGASGAISGVVMSSIIIGPAMREEIWIFGFLPGWLFAILYIVSSHFASRRQYDNVAHEAHMWGAIAGIVFSFIMFPMESWKFIESMRDTLYGWTH